MTDSLVARRIGANLAEARQKIGISQEELSFRAALHRTAVGQLERAERIPRADTLVKLAAALRVPAGELLIGIAWEVPRFDAGRFKAED